MGMDGRRRGVWTCIGLGMLRFLTWVFEGERRMPRRLVDQTPLSDLSVMPCMPVMND